MASPPRGSDSPRIRPTRLREDRSSLSGAGGKFLKEFYLVSYLGQIPPRGPAASRLPHVQRMKSAALKQDREEDFHPFQRHC